MKISVVIPVYNEEKYIASCLQSIVSQTEKPDEIIVVDNNCTDKTIEIAKKFGVRIVREKNQGMIPARNTGFNLAKFEIIARTDADVILPPDWISKIKKYFKDPNLGGLSGPGVYFELPIFSEISKFGNFVAFKLIALFFGNEMLAGPNMILRKLLWEKIKDKICLDDNNTHEDIDLSIHLSKIAKIKYDWNFSIKTTRGRWIKIFTEYIARLSRMFIYHKFLKSGSGRKA